MRQVLEIHYPPQKMSQNKRRFQARLDFRYEDRVPVLFGVFTRYFLQQFWPLNYDEYFRDPETQFNLQLQFQKWAIENIPDDRCQEPVVTVGPDFENELNTSALGGRVQWVAENPPRALPTIRHPEEVDRFKIPEIHEGFWAKYVHWWQTMKELAKETIVTFNGQPGRVAVMPLAIQFIGPHMIAVDLVGDDFYWWVIEHPKASHTLLERITNSLIHAENCFRKLDPTPRPTFALAEDSAQIMSASLFREFCVPYDNKLFDTFGLGLRDGRGMHMCGKSDHLHQALLEEEKITSLFLFGREVKPAVAAKNLGGRCYLWGNLDPIMLLDGPKEKIRGATIEFLEALAPCRGIVLGDGANVCPGTPLENLRLVLETTQQYCLEHPQLFTDSETLGSATMKNEK
ncbi:MAG: uroporphyrinogen decarboxylase family protein [Terriglobia bacterium]